MKCELSVNEKCSGNFSPLKCDGINVPKECKEKGNLKYKTYTDPRLEKKGCGEWFDRDQYRCEGSSLCPKCSPIIKTTEEGE